MKKTLILSFVLVFSFATSNLFSRELNANNDLNYKVIENSESNQTLNAEMETAIPPTLLVVTVGYAVISWTHHFTHIVEQPVENGEVSSVYELRQLD
ncbi:hypothetical protein [Empedobacter brevis]|uniref:hypothetical protein n=1 Tax=Empedobacter brevis TaxID=247 RepID=UPI002898B045|nr:hypothetical protein [Empedobacter brevis]